MNRIIWVLTFYNTGPSLFCICLVIKKRFSRIHVCGTTPNTIKCLSLRQADFYIGMFCRSIHHDVICLHKVIVYFTIICMLLPLKQHHCTFVMHSLCDGYLHAHGDIIRQMCQRLCTSLVSAHTIRTCWLLQSIMCTCKAKTTTYKCRLFMQYARLVLL